MKRKTNNICKCSTAETFKYAIDLRAMTQGRGYFEMELETYEEVPAQLAQKIIELENNK